MKGGWKDGGESLATVVLERTESVQLNKRPVILKVLAMVLIFMSLAPSIKLRDNFLE